MSLSSGEPFDATLWRTLGGESEQTSDTHSAVSLLRAGMKDLAAVVEVCRLAIDQDPGMTGPPVSHVLSLAVRLAELYPVAAEHFESTSGNPEVT